MPCASRFGANCGSAADERSVRCDHGFRTGDPAGSDLWTRYGAEFKKLIRNARRDGRQNPIVVGLGQCASIFDTHHPAPLRRLAGETGGREILLRGDDGHLLPCRTSRSQPFGRRRGCWIADCVGHLASHKTGSIAAGQGSPYYWQVNNGPHRIFPLPHR